MKNSILTSNRFLFLLLLTFEIGHVLFLILTHRIPIGHDGFQYFSMQYYFLNDSAVNHEIPLWIPYMNHGLPATWYYTIQGSIGLLVNALFLAGQTIASVNFQNIFHWGIFTDRLILLTGVWLLGKRYFDSPLTRFFVASSIMGSTVTMTQFNFTLHLYYAIPLVIYLVHTFLDTGLWRYFFLACNLFVMQTFGKNADTLTIVSLTVFLYFLFYALDQSAQFLGGLKALRWRSSSWAAITGALLSLGLLGAIFMTGKDPDMVNLNVGRNLDSSVPLNTFLTYAGNMDFHKWQECLLRLSPSLDFTLYMGFLSLPLVFFGLFNTRSRIKYPLALTILILLFFSMGTWISVFFYYAWPAMKFYRHLALISGVIKLLMIFLAGFGFEKIFIHQETWQYKRPFSYALLMAGAMLCFVSVALTAMSHNGFQASHYIVRYLTVQTSQTPSTFDPLTVSLRIGVASLYALLTGTIFILLPLARRKKPATMLLTAVLILNAFDIYGYYCTEMNERTFPLNKAQYKITAFSPTPYAPRRLVDAPNPRQDILISPISQHTLYVTVNAFLFQDALATRYRTIERLRPFQEMISAFGPKVLKNPAFLKIAGSTQDKIQFFDQACTNTKDKETASWLVNPQFRGDRLFLSGPSTADMAACSRREDLRADQRLPIGYHIRTFTPNSVSLSVDVPAGKPVWMMYADVWHRGWKADVNGKPAALFKADMAYKALLLRPGKNKIRMAFVSWEINFLERTAALNALLWLLILVYLTAGNH